MMDDDAPITKARPRVVCQVQTLSGKLTDVRMGDRYVRDLPPVARETK